MRLLELLKKKRKQRFFSRLIERGHLCFDIGANVGDKSDLFTNAGAKVIAVEPQSACCEKLSERFKENNNIEIVNAAVGLKKQVLELKVSNVSQISTFSQEFIDAYSYYDEFNWNGREMVQMTTLDNLIDKYGIPDFCKIDIEGYEKEALRGLSHLIPLISIEFNYPLKYLAIECLDIVKKFEPVVTNYVKFETPRFELDQWVDIKQMKKIVSDMTPDIKTGDIYIRKLES